MKRIVVFDSGVGGVRFAKELEKATDDVKITVIQDTSSMPYGSKSPNTIQRLTEAALRPALYDMDTKTIVIACNTATAYAIDYLRRFYPNKIFIGFEPAIKQAREVTKSRAIAIFATPATLKSPRYKALKKSHGAMLSIYEPNVSTLAAQIENRQVNWGALRVLVKNLVRQNVDTIVLGCTHYHLIQNTFQHFAGDDVAIITPTEAVIRHVKKYL